MILSVVCLLPKQRGSLMLFVLVFRMKIINRFKCTACSMSTGDCGGEERQRNWSIVTAVLNQDLETHTGVN